MKFVKSLLVIFLLCSSYVISTSNLLTRNKNKNNFHYQNKIKNKKVKFTTSTTAGFLSTILKYIVSPENMFYFVLGVLSEWIDVAKIAFKSSALILPLVIGCFNTNEVVKATNEPPAKDVVSKLAKTPETKKEDPNIIEAMEKSYNYFKVTSNAFKCIKLEQSKILSVLPSVKDLFGVDITDLVSNVAGAVLHFFTGGISGAVRGAVLLAQFASMVSDATKLALVLDKDVGKIKDFAYLAGQAVGKAISAAKAFLLGKKKIKKLRRMRKIKK